MPLKKNLEDEKVIKDILKHLPDNLKNSFYDGYLLARLSFWDKMIIKKNRDIKVEVLLPKETYQPFKDSLSGFLLRQLKDFALD
ncbi:MAG: hypothetical protein LWW90_07620 [Candidatus Desulfofervidus auxilii]|nr:hypothetical protein [Candidatus Desulfofervidus auxilii]